MCIPVHYDRQPVLRRNQLPDEHPLGRNNPRTHQTVRFAPRTDIVLERAVATLHTDMRNIARNRITFERAASRVCRGLSAITFALSAGCGAQALRNGDSTLGMVSMLLVAAGYCSLKAANSNQDLINQYERLVQTPQIP